MHPLISLLDVDGWRPVRFALNEAQSPNEAPSLGEALDATDDTALRREQWIVAGDQYVFVERASPGDEWSAPEIGEWSYLEGDEACGDKVATLDDLLPIARRARDNGASVHPALLDLLNRAAA